MNRRTFLGRTAATTAGALLSSRFSFSMATQHKIDKVGVQLYTVRDDMQKDFDGTLAKVAAIGYKEVEFAGYFDHSPKDIRAALERHGLASPSTHIPYKSLGADFPKVIEDSKTIGQSYIVNPWVEEEIRNQPDSWKHIADTFNRAGEMSKKAGIQFAYHNHWFEFLPVNGKLPYDILLEACDPNLVKMELDLCWITVGGNDPLKYFKKYPGRFPLVHVKDVTKIPPVGPGGSQDFGSSMKEMTYVGGGIIDWKAIFAHADEAGIKHYFVEHDYPASPFDSIRKSFDYLHNLRF